MARHRVRACLRSDVTRIAAHCGIRLRHLSNSGTEALNAIRIANNGSDRVSYLVDCQGVCVLQVGQYFREGSIPGAQRIELLIKPAQDQSCHAMATKNMSG